MSDVELAIGYEETPVFFGTDGMLFGIVTEPLGTGNGIGVIVLPGAGTPLSTNRNRVTVRMCRGLASMGYTSFRMDYHGAGESLGEVGVWDLAQLGPFVDDVAAGIEHLKTRGLGRFVIIGTTCFGSRAAMAAAVGSPEVKEVLAFATPLRDGRMGERLSSNAAMRRSLGRYLLEACRPRTVKGLFDRRSRRLYRKYARAKFKAMGGRLRKSRGVGATPDPGQLSPGFKHDLGILVDRRIPILLVFGTEEDYYRQFLEAKEGVLRDLLARAGPTVRVMTIPGRLHGLPRVDVQRAAVETVLKWGRHRDMATVGPKDDLSENGKHDIG